MTWLKMASIYILYSPSLRKYYIGSCKDVIVRIDQHFSVHFPGAFTAKTIDWIVYYMHDDLNYLQARKIEAHIKKMKSKKFIENLKKYPEILERLKKLY